MYYCLVAHRLTVFFFSFLTTTARFFCIISWFQGAISFIYHKMNWGTQKYFYFFTLFLYITICTYYAYTSFIVMLYFGIIIKKCIIFGIYENCERLKTITFIARPSYSRNNSNNKVHYAIRLEDMMVDAGWLCIV